MQKLQCLILITIWASVCCIVQIPQGYILYPFNNTFPQQYNNSGCKSNALNSTGSHHLFLGCVRNTDKLIFVQVIKLNIKFVYCDYLRIALLYFFQQIVKPARWWSSREKIIDYPGDVASGIRPLTITGIRVWDNYFNGSGGYCSIIGGGIDYQHVRLRLYSKSAGKGINFTVKIYGK